MKRWRSFIYISKIWWENKVEREKKNLVNGFQVYAENRQVC